MDADLMELIKAIELANNIRTAHNGVAGVYLYLGHDGDNVCDLRDSSRAVVGTGGSGRSLLEAVERAERSRRMGQFQKRRDAVAGIAALAAERFAGNADATGLFNTAHVQAVIEEQYCVKVTAEEVVDLLTAEPRVVRLHGGCHWFLLPKEYRRQV